MLFPPLKKLISFFFSSENSRFERTVKRESLFFRKIEADYIKIDMDKKVKKGLICNARIFRLDLGAFSFQLFVSFQIDLFHFANDRGNFAFDSSFIFLP